jgi:serine/threonine-protein kinase
MSSRFAFACALGHEWEIVLAENHFLGSKTLPCPVCGASSESNRPTIPASDAVPETRMPPAGIATPAAGTKPDARDKHPTRPPEGPSTSVVLPDAIETSGYEILELLGRGGMGVVYKARQKELNRLVALKMILTGTHAGAEEVSRFQREAEAIARLHHPNIVEIHDVGLLSGRPFFSLEYCEGGTLGERLRQRPLAARDAAELVEQIARGVQTAHENNVLHRDLKPANILLQRKSEIRHAQAEKGDDPGA